jgi:hypothetical protein
VRFRRQQAVLVAIGVALTVACLLWARVAPEGLTTPPDPLNLKSAVFVIAFLSGIMLLMLAALRAFVRFVPDKLFDWRWRFRDVGPAPLHSFTRFIFHIDNRGNDLDA